MDVEAFAEQFPYVNDSDPLAPVLSYRADGNILAQLLRTATLS